LLVQAGELHRQLPGELQQQLWRERLLAVEPGGQRRECFAFWS
jgi:hypothetical protein